jgi:hypothetical protein
MTLDWTSFFPPGTRVLALPNWKHPRLYLPAQSFFQNWQDSAFYPASRFLARVYRVSLRTRAAVGLGETRKVQSSHWPLGEFTREVLPEAESVVTLVGTPGPAQKITVRVLDGRGEVLAYLKYAEKEAARKRLRQECRMLHHLPGGAGPEVLKFGPFADGEALLITALTGKRLSTSLPPPEGSKDFLASLVLSAPLPSKPTHGHGLFESNAVPYSNRGSRSWPERAGRLWRNTATLLRGIYCGGQAAPWVRSTGSTARWKVSLTWTLLTTSFKSRL